MRQVAGRLRRRTVVIVAATCLLAGGVLTGAQAQPSKQLPNLLHSGSTSGAESGTRTGAESAAKPGDGLPPPPKGVPDFPLFAYIDKTVQSVKKAKISFNIPPIVIAAYILAVNEQPPVPGYQWLDSTGYIYVTSPKHSKQAYGIFPSVTVKALGFGAIPITATVHIEQYKKRNGTIEPMVLKVRATQATPPNPPDGLPCSAPAQSPPNCLFTDPPHVTGEVDVRIDNVKVDGVPLDVGNNCHTGSPAQLTLSSPAGYYSGFTDPQYYPDNLYIPFQAGGTLSGIADVPDFTGCHNGNDELDPLISAMVAGPGNAITIHQEGPLTPTPPTLPH